MTFLLALGLRLLVWRWHELYDLGGDEREYFNQALTLLRQHVYVELNLMRPPLYTGFLAACMYLFDSLVQRVRLVQAIVSALTIVPIYLLARRLFGRRVGLLAALLAALSYTLAAHATELLTETLFMFGLATLFWLLPVTAATDDGRQTTDDGRPWVVGGRQSVVGRRSSVVWPLLAGLNLGALVLVRSVALPLLALGTLWLLLNRPRMKDQGPRTISSDATRASGIPWSLVFRRWSAPVCFVLGAALVILPWTARNYATYGAIILVDTTGAENLWLDNNPAGSAPGDPLGREAAKRQLYALGDDQAARQRLAAANGAAAIRAHPAWFLQKVWGEAEKFFALEYFDDMRERRAIWAPPLEVGLRLALGDGLWLLLLFGGAAGLWLAPKTKVEGPRTEDQKRSSLVVGRWSLVDPRWVFVPWVLYILLTSMLFHVELRYRLPVYPVLLPYAAWALALVAGFRRQGIGDRGQGIGDKGRVTGDGRQERLVSRVSHLASPAPQSPAHLVILSAGAALTCLAIAGITLLHRPYVGEAWMLASKHARLWQADRALDRGNAADARTAADAALALDPESALARVALARAALARGNRPGALARLDEAIVALRAHPYAHLLRGAILRDGGDLAAARAEFEYEQASLEDLQSWSWRAFAPFAAPPSAIGVGAGLDLGYVRGFWSAEPGGSRWSKSEAEIALGAAQARGGRLVLDLNGGRPAGAASPRVSISAGGREVGQILAAPGWHSYSFGIPAELTPATGRLIVTIRSDTFRPRDFDRASPDNRALGVMVRRVEIQTP